MADRAGENFGDYILIRLLGRGSFGEVYLGEHVYLGSKAAIKILHATLPEGEFNTFLEEARKIVTLNHPHIVRLLGFSKLNNTPFLVMQFAPGGTLLKRYPRNISLPLETVLSYVRQCADALHYAHERSLIHLDLKPENLLLGEQDELLLADFGISRVLQHGRTHVSTSFVGTPVYAAPEQFQGKPGPASDQYALATMIYEWLTGALPFTAPDLIALGFKKNTEAPPPLRVKAPAIPPDVEEVVLTALAKDPKERFASMRAFATAFEAACQTLSYGRTFGDLPTVRQPAQPAGPALPDRPTRPLEPPGGVGVPAYPPAPAPAPTPTLPPTRELTPPISPFHLPLPGHAPTPAPAGSGAFHWGRAALGGSFGLLFGALFFLAALLSLSTIAYPTDTVGVLPGPGQSTLGSLGSTVLPAFGSALFDLIAVCYPLAGMLVVGGISGYAQSRFNWRRAALRCIRTVLGMEVGVALTIIVLFSVLSLFSRGVLIIGDLVSLLLTVLLVTFPCGLILGAIRGARPGPSSFSWGGFWLGLGATIAWDVLVIVAGLLTLADGSFRGDFPAIIILLHPAVGVIWGNVEAGDWSDRFKQGRFYRGMIGIWIIIFLFALLEAIQMQGFLRPPMLWNTYAYAAVPAGLAFGILVGFSGYWLFEPPPRLVWVRPLVCALVGVLIGAMLGFVLEPFASYPLAPVYRLCRVGLYPAEVLRQQLQNADACSAYLSSLLAPSLATLRNGALIGGVCGLMFPFLRTIASTIFAAWKRCATWLHELGW